MNGWKGYGWKGGRQLFCAVQPMVVWVVWIVWPFEARGDFFPGSSELVQVGKASGVQEGSRKTGRTAAEGGIIGTDSRKANW